MATWSVDRSRVLTAQACPRKRYWEYHYRGQGIQRKSKSLPLLLGGAFHDGVAALMQGGSVDEAVEVAIFILKGAFESSAVELGEEGTDNATYAQLEQLALVEGMIRAWWAFEGPSFIDQFDVIECEQEGRVDLGDGIELMYRPDAVLREKSSGEYYVLSWKSCAMYTRMTYNQATSDMQSISEVYGTQIKHGVKVEGVFYKYIVKGRRTMDEYLGQYRQDSPLIYGWRRMNHNDPLDAEWAFRYKWASEEEGRKFEQLPKGFRKISIWDNYEGGVKAWIEALAAREITPRHIDPFESLFPQSLPVTSRADEIESWRVQTVAAERRIQGSVNVVAGHNYNMNRVDEEFPQHTQRCYDYASRCSFWDACFTPAVKADPLASGLYNIRISNHPEGKGDAE